MRLMFKIPQMLFLRKASPVSSLVFEGATNPQLLCPVCMGFSSCLFDLPLDRTDTTYLFCVTVGRCTA